MIETFFFSITSSAINSSGHLTLLDLFTAGLVLSAHSYYVDLGYASDFDIAVFENTTIKSQFRLIAQVQ